jgi:hypothetical protein
MCERGSTFWRHLDCVDRGQAVQLLKQKNPFSESNIKGTAHTAGPLSCRPPGLTLSSWSPPSADCIAASFIIHQTRVRARGRGRWIGWNGLAEDAQSSAKTRIEACAAAEAKKKGGAAKGAAKPKSTAPKKKAAAGEGGAKKKAAKRKKADDDASGSDSDDDSGKAKKGKKEKAPKDPNAPKRPLTAYMAWSLVRRKELKESNPELKARAPSLSSVRAQCTDMNAVVSIACFIPVVRRSRWAMGIRLSVRLPLL